MQLTALQHHCRLSCETIHPRFYKARVGYSVGLTVNSGYECLQEGYGGPVWHISIAPLKGYALTIEQAREIALKELLGVGAILLGQWEDWTGTVFHMRRRLTADERKGIGDVIDIRGTDEQERRWKAVLPYLPVGYKDWKG